jgi:hypothetical protein
MDSRRQRGRTDARGGSRFARANAVETSMATDDPFQSQETCASQAPPRAVSEARLDAGSLRRAIVQELFSCDGLRSTNHTRRRWHSRRAQTNPGDRAPTRASTASGWGSRARKNLVGAVKPAPRRSSGRATGPHPPPESARARVLPRGPAPSVSSSDGRLFNSSWEVRSELETAHVYARGDALLRLRSHIEHECA